MVNLLLLANPSTLSFDWSMDAIPLVESISDNRNIISALFYVILAAAATRILVKLSPRLKEIVNSSEKSLSVCGGRKIDTIQVMALALSLIILPFLPATNLFFYVGFVVAERVLYLPSLGYCLMLAQAIHTSSTILTKLSNKSKLSKRLNPEDSVRGLIGIATVCLVFSFVCRTVSRCEDWSDEESLFHAGIPVNPAKSWTNFATALEGKGRLVEAELAFKQALLHRANMADTHYNLGKTLKIYI